jgi:xylan 1,4-beta-xylosidase
LMIFFLRTIMYFLLWQKSQPTLLFALGIMLILNGITWAQPRNLTVDAAQVTGVIRSFQGVNCGPASFMPGLADVSRQYQDLRIDMVRVHDFFGPGDIDARWVEPLDPISRWVKADGRRSIFPNWEADPEKESSYNFGPTDRIIQAIIAGGAEVYFRLGRSWGAEARPPSDFAKYAEICRHVVMHYNGGWAKGYHYNIRYWEIWNEPDLQMAWAPNFIRPFWTGTPEQYYDLYERVARAIKGYDATLKVGGPAKARPELSDGYREEFLQYCAKRKVPLDFYSWHLYQTGQSPRPYLLAQTARMIRSMLDEHGFNQAENILSEWNMSVTMNTAGPRSPSSLLNAAFISSALTYLQEAPLDRALFYRGDPTVMGLFEAGGQYRRNAAVFKFFGAMLDTPQRLAVNGGDDRGFALLAGRSADGSLVQLIITQYNGEAETEFKFNLQNLPWGEADYEVKRYKIPEEASTPAEPLIRRGGRFETNGSLPANGVEFIILRKR